MLLKLDERFAQIVR